MFQFLMIVDDPEIAAFVSKNGVDRLFVDLEYIGKAVRQGGMDTWKSHQTLHDVTKIRDAAPDGHLLVRVNPIHEGSRAEIDEAVARGADSVMLPMFRTMQELHSFFDMLAGRAEAVPLVETAAALALVPEAAKELGLTRLHFGLNDLHLDLGDRFMFQPLAEGRLDAACAALRDAGVKFGIGGIARAREGIVSPDYLLGEHVRLGSDAAIVSRTFHRSAQTLDELRENMDFAAEISKLREIYQTFQTYDAAALEQNRVDTNNRIQDVVQLMAEKKK